LICLLGEFLEDSGSFLRFLSVDRVLDRLWSRIYLLRCWDFTHVSGFGYYFIWMYLWVDDMTTWGVCYISAVMFYCWNFFMHVNCELFEDVTSISWIFIIFAWFIALIEVGRYNEKRWFDLEGCFLEWVAGKEGLWISFSVAICDDVWFRRWDWFWWLLFSWVLNVDA